MGGDVVVVGVVVIENLETLENAFKSHGLELKELGFL